MLLVEENHLGASTSMHIDNKMFYTEEDRPRPVVMVDEVGRHAMYKAEKRKNEDMRAVSIIIPNCSEAGGVKAGPETGKQKG